ncbi:MAG: RagB/SusD family nutrient uptake outer membrane protein [Bacteroidaceae bacterium]|nr:RagB/SusD family nutrient uptake outer membrane protein [Bacteroidaceae bacterium]
MKRTIIFAISILLLCCTTALISCKEESSYIIPEVSVPNGYVNYFIEDLSLDSDSCEVKIAFQINTKWTMDIVYLDGATSWCYVEPNSGNAGLHKVVLRIDSNDSDTTRSAKIQLKVAAEKIAEIVVKQDKGVKTVVPPDVIVIENYWKTKADVENVVSNAYRLMTDFEFSSRLLAWSELRGDNVIKGDYAPTDIRSILDVNLLPTNSYTSWGDFYEVINNCNIVLKYAPSVLALDSEYTEEEWNVHRGEMLTIRALCHFYLVRTFRDIPLLTEVMSNDSQNLYPSQVSPIVALDQILTDLYEAEILVMKSGGYPTNTENKGRVTSDAVRAIIADVLLWKAAFTQYESVGSDGLCDQYYTECIAYCDLIIDGFNQRGNFDFSNDGKDYPMVYSFNDEPQSEGNKAYDAVFGTQNSEESILELQYSNNYYNSFIPYFYGREEGNDAIIVASDYLSQMSSSITEGLYCSTDIRRASFINVMYESDKNLPITKYTARTHNGVFSKLHSQLTPVYREIEVIDGRPAINSNWIMYRITDILLMKAEALAYRADATSMDLENAFEIVSAVYYRSNRIDEVAAENRLSFPQNAEDMRALVLVERQRELAFEGKRWYDLVRKALCDGETAPMLDLLVEHKYESNHKAIRTKLSNISSLFFPICEREININPNLKQNEAYVTE